MNAEIRFASRIGGVALEWEVASEVLTATTGVKFVWCRALRKVQMPGRGRRIKSADVPNRFRELQIFHLDHLPAALSLRPAV